jgi:hypothetical protein
MATKPTWRARAEAVIAREIAAGRALDLTDAQIRRRVDDAYPFGERRYWPYKAWLQARHRMLDLPGSLAAAERARLRAWESGAKIVDSGAPKTPLEEYLEGL